ncbi:hypothetical protein HY633_05050 [Candidatus Uhrbacteria bacterium]|nr:hypothetical protein [Candidatus Uhrbacteria bacterium]
MLDQDFFASLKERYAAHERGRREVIGLSAAAQSASKRAIFALHRDDAAGAAKLLAEAAEALAKVRALFDGRSELAEEGSYRAALEEYVEAKLYAGFLENGRVGAIEGEEIDYEIYLGGLSDLTGELVRRQVLVATAGKLDEVRRVKGIVEEIVGRLMEMDLTGYLRNKFDQAKNSLRRAEDVLYEVTIRRG